MLSDPSRTGCPSFSAFTQSIGFDIELPSALRFDVRHTDREVILASADLKTSDLALSNPLAGSFAVTCVVQTGLGPIPIRRGWVSVESTCGARTSGSSARTSMPRSPTSTTRSVAPGLASNADCLPFPSAIQMAQAAGTIVYNVALVDEQYRLVPRADGHRRQLLSKHLSRRFRPTSPFEIRTRPRPGIFSGCGARS
jgi:hypothetical protein